MRIVVALGGNALLTRGERPDDDVQREHVAAAVDALAPLAAHHELIVTHGNGPQVGVLAVESATDRTLSHPYPLDSLGAETQGLIGYWLTQEIRNRLPGRSVVAVVTQTRVDPLDPAFEHPTKFVGPVYDADESARVAARRGWTMAEDGDRWRRVVASPEPLAITEIGTIRRLVEDGVVVVCAGGGGIPVARTGVAGLTGVEAVVDKDLTSALLAEQLGADALLLLTDVDGVLRDFGGPDAELVREASVGELRAAGFPAGSMGPKVEAACRFVERTGAVAAIGSLRDVEAILAGDRGTRIVAHDEVDVPRGGPTGDAVIDATPEIWGTGYSTDSATVERSYDAFAETGAFDETFDEWGYVGPETAAAIARNYVPLVSDVLDAACGSGLTGTALRRLGYRRITGIDISARLLELAERTGAYRRLERVDMQVFPLPFADAEFDAVHFIGALTYFETSEILRELCRIVRPGGHVVFSQRDDLMRERGDGADLDRIERDGTWQRVFGTEPMPYLPHHPQYGDDIRVRYFVYRVV